MTSGLISLPANPLTHSVEYPARAHGVVPIQLRISSNAIGHGHGKGLFVRPMHRTRWAQLKNTPVYREID